ncbi:hypothetical protein MHBO_001550 [Bonamia ostreae]|uniref:C3H1-type domain-containing protein n=1 Tax=Bonamia ostreae TaxID=126728 RepID=A0ABV2AK81_9EUKA
MSDRCTFSEEKYCKNGSSCPFIHSIQSEFFFSKMAKIDLNASDFLLSQNDPYMDIEPLERSKSSRRRQRKKGIPPYDEYRHLYSERKLEQKSLNDFSTEEPNERNDKDNAHDAQRDILGLLEENTWAPQNKSPKIGKNKNRTKMKKVAKWECVTCKAKEKIPWSKKNCPNCFCLRPDLLQERVKK